MVDPEPVILDLFNHLRGSTGFDIQYGALNLEDTQSNTFEFDVPEFEDPAPVATGGLYARLLLNGFVAGHLDQSASLSERLAVFMKIRKGLLTWSKTPYPDGLGDTLIGFTYTKGSGFMNPFVVNESMAVYTISFNWSMDLLLEVT